MYVVARRLVPCAVPTRHLPSHATEITPQYAAPTHTGTLANDRARSGGIANPAIPERLGREGLLLHSQAAAERALMRQAWKPPWHLALPTLGRDERSVQGCDRAVTAATVAQQGIAARLAVMASTRTRTGRLSTVQVGSEHCPRPRTHTKRWQHAFLQRLSALNECFEVPQGRSMCGITWPRTCRHRSGESPATHRARTANPPTRATCDHTVAPQCFGRRIPSTTRHLHPVGVVGGRCERGRCGSGHGHRSNSHWRGGGFKAAKR